MDNTQVRAVVEKRKLDLNELEKPPYCEIPAHFFDLMLQRLMDPDHKDGETVIIEMKRHNLPDC